MVQRNFPLADADSQAIAIAPDITYRKLQRLIDETVLMPRPFLFLHAEPNLSTLCSLFAAWARSIPVLLVPPGTVLPSFSFSPSVDLALFTSGSTGFPKIACFKKEQLFESATTISRALKAGPGSRWLLSLPLHHVGGLGVALRALCSGGTLVFANKTLPYPDRFLSAHADFASCVPTQLFRLLKTPLPPTSTHFLVGGAPLAHSLYTRAQLQGLRLSLTYGLTEMSSTVLLSQTPFWQDSLPFLGMPLPGRMVTLREEELLVQGIPLFEGYGSPPQRPSPWFPTGDLALYDERYGYKILGRKDSLFLCGGENVYPEEIEVALLSLPEVEQAVVVPVDDEEFGSRPCAFVKATLSQKELVRSLHSMLPKHKIPIAFFPLEDADSLKPNRKKLLSLFIYRRE